MRMIAALSCAFLVSACGDDQAKDAVRLYLSDPDSAVFEHMTSKDGVTCGVVNSRNRMGGMTGQRLFIVNRSVVKFGGPESSISDAEMGVCSLNATGVLMRQMAGEIS